jgi:hypothetical protein
MVWRNYVKSRSERKRDDPPSVALGIESRRLSVREILAARRFPWRRPLRGWLERCYFARIPTRAIGRVREHQTVFTV